jgi:hypothetical protein
MKKITNILVGLLFASSLSFTSAIQAGELSVTGGVTATITQGGRSQNGGKQVGVSNELAFGASGELDNGWTWKYQTELDGTSTITDDVQLTLSGDFGTVGFFASEGGLSADVISVGALGSGKDYADTVNGWKVGYDVDGYGNLQYHLPSGMIPFGGSVKIGYAPSLANTNVNSAKGNEGGTNDETAGRDLTQVRLDFAPIDGLTVAGDYAWTNSNPSSATTPSAKGEQGVSGNVQAVYTAGPAKIGYSRGAHQPGLAAGASTVYYENTAYGISFALNENVTISYNNDQSEKTTNALAATGTSRTQTHVTMEQETYQIAYTMGGMTVGLSTAEATNSGYATGAANVKSVNILSVAMSF